MDLKQYISDNVVQVSHRVWKFNLPVADSDQILGSSDSATVDFVHSLGMSNRLSSATDRVALSSKTAGDLYASLLATGLSDSPESQAFAAQLHKLVPQGEEEEVQD